MSELKVYASHACINIKGKYSTVCEKCGRCGRVFQSGILVKPGPKEKEWTIDDKKYYACKLLEKVRDKRADLIEDEKVVLEILKEIEKEQEKDERSKG